MVEVGAHLQPLGGVAVDVVAVEQHGERGGHTGAVLGEPVGLEDAQRRRHARVHGLLVLAAQHGERGEVRQRQSVERGLLAVQVQRDGAVELRAPHQRHQWHGRRAQLLHVLRHGHGCVARSGLGNAKRGAIARAQSPCAPHRLRRRRPTPRPGRPAPISVYDARVISFDTVFLPFRHRGDTVEMLECGPSIRRHWIYGWLLRAFVS